MKLFIFEPYQWEYCGGTIVVIAENYDQAIDLLLDIKDENGELEYGRDYFSTDPDDFTYGWDQWLLSQEIELKDNLEPKVIVQNWNYA
jgi:hypothetical protein